MKKIVRLSLWTLGVLLLLVGVFYFFLLDPIIRSVVQSTAQKTLGTPTTLAGANLSAVAGKLTLTGFDVANPADFKLPQFVGFKSCAVTVRPTSLLSDTIEVDEILIDGLHLTLEQNGPMRNNLVTILGNIQKQRNTNDNTKEGQSKQLKIKKVRLTNTVLTIRMAPLPNQAAPETNTNLGPIELVNPTNPDGRLMKFADLTGKILVQIAAQAANDTQVPGAVRTAFQATSKLFDQNVGKLFSDLNVPLDQIGSSLTQPLDKTAKNITDLFGGKKVTAPKN